MKNYKYKYMNEDMIKELNELWDNGHAEALAAYALECAEAGIEGYKKGYVIGSALAVLAAGLGVATGFAVRKIRERRVLGKKIKEFNEYVDNLKPGELKLNK